MGFTDLDKPCKTLGADNVNISSPASSFGEILTANIRPIGQGDFVYGINNQMFITSSFAGSTIEAVGGSCELSSGTSASGSATVQLRRGLKYRAGQGSLMKATAVFDTPDAGNAQFIGAGTAECGYFVGYFGENFGILHSISGSREIRKLTITTGAGTGDVTVTLNGNAVVVPVVGGSNPEQTAYQLSLSDYSQVGSGGWLADAQGASVYFISARSAETFTGTYSVAGASIVGSFTRTQEGQNQSNDFIASSLFNVDRLDGNGPSGMTLDPQKGNIYQISFQYLGYGNARFSVECPSDGKLNLFHEIQNANNRTDPVLKNPNVSVLATSANIGGTTSKKLKTSSMGGFIEGQIITLDPKFAKSFTFSSVNSATYKPLALFKVNRVFRDQSCFGEFDIIEVNGSNETAASSPKTITIALFLGAEITGEVDYQYIDENNSVVSYAELDPGSGGDTITNLSDITPFYEFVIGAGQGINIDITRLRYVFNINQPVLIAIKTSGAASGKAGIIWFEQQ